MESSLTLRELAQEAHRLFEERSATKKRMLLSFLLSNSTWAHGELKTQFAQPLDFLVEMGASAHDGHQRENAEMA